MSSSTYGRDSCNSLQIIGSKSYFYVQKHVTAIRKTLCSWVCAFVFCFNLLHQLVMLALGPEQPYHKKHSPEKVGQQSVDPCLFANFSHNYAKIQNSFE